MVLLMLFALVAGAGTALSPCVLPILPAVLSVGVTGGRRRPLGLVTGLALSFTFATVALVYLIDALGLPGDIARTIAIVTLIGFGLTLLIPPAADRVEAFASRLAPGPAGAGGDGFWSGMLVGSSLGLVYAPCAGPILAGVITVSASQDFTAGRLAIALCYAIGSAAVLYAVLLGGRRFTDRLAPIRGRIQAAVGAIMLAVAIVMVADWDTRFQTAIADHLPGILVNPTGGLEQAEAVSEDLASVGGHGGGGFGAVETRLDALGEAIELPKLGYAPDFMRTQSWFNTPGGGALSMAGLRGRVVLLDFWTYTCINCIRTFPHLRAWDAAYRDDGLTIVGVHAPEFPFERDPANVARAVEQNRIEYPVVQDNEFGTWTAYGNQYWPAKYLIDAEGQVRYTHFGEGDYDETEAAIRLLLQEAGSGVSGASRARGEVASPGVRTAETYLGADRADGFAGPPIRAGRRSFGAPPAALELNQFAYGGEWRITAESATAVSEASISLRFGAERVFLVMGSPGRPRQVRVLLDGEPIAARNAGSDVRDGIVTTRGERLYRLVDLPRAGTHDLRLEFERGTEGYAFTFG